jgi:hypothetical protein
MWRIDAITCDGKPFNNTNPFNNETVLQPDDYFAGSCADLGDTDVELFYLFQMGIMCYPQYAQQLRAKANVTMTSELDLFTTR